jgi:hypothetical protein
MSASKTTSNKKRLSDAKPASANTRATTLDTTTKPSDESETKLQSPVEFRNIFDRLKWTQKRFQKDLKQREQELVVLQDYLGISEKVTEALDALSQKLFEEVLGMLQEKLSIALQEVLNQPIKFKADASFKRGAASVDFSIDRDGNTEDVNRGQGGSVQNVLSVGLRLFALASPELVPKLVNIVHRAAKELKFQVIMISHHDVGLFEKYADKIYRFNPNADGALSIEEVSAPPVASDDHLDD